MKPVRFLLLLILFSIFVTGSGFSVYINHRMYSFDTDETIPPDYYNRACIIHMDVKLWLTAAKWAHSYEANSWDCSQMAAFTEWALENCGYDTNIVLVRTGIMSAHAYNLVEIDGEWQIYEAVTRKLVQVTTPQEKWIYNKHTRVVFKTLHSCYYFLDKHYDSEAFQRELAWWRKK